MTVECELYVFGRFIVSEPPVDAAANLVPASLPQPLKVIAGTPDRPLIIGDIEIQCYVLEDETRALSQGGFLRAIGRSRTPKAGTGGVDNVPAFLAPKNLNPFVSNHIVVSTTPILFQPPSGGVT